MNSYSHWFLARKGKVVRLGLSPRDISRWGIWLNDQLLCDNFGSAEEAALCAHEKDFGDEAAIDIFGRISVPSDLNAWRTTPPEEPAPNLTESPPSDCKSRRRRGNSNRLEP